MENLMPSKIIVHKNETADTRSCDFSKVTKEQLIRSSKAHIEDVKRGLEFFKEMLDDSAKSHDFDKIENINQFHSDFVGGFNSTVWWENHQKVNRHHLLVNNGVPDDVNLIDVLEMITDCVIAGKTRTGVVFPIELSNDVLEKAFKNTVSLMIQSVQLRE
jgi:hypothetical protein